MPVDINTLREYVKNDLITMSSNNDNTLFICNYTPKVQYEQLWDDITLMCRGLIVDVNGTVAKMNGRTAYEWNKVDTDLPKDEIINIVKTFQHKYTIIFLSGRDYICYDKTMQWLKHNVSGDFHLYMRPLNDTRKDSIVKKELFYNHIYNNYYVQFVLDDRQQVVDMWRKEIGLTCLQVDYGDF